MNRRHTPDTIVAAVTVPVRPFGNGKVIEMNGKRRIAAAVIACMLVFALLASGCGKTEKPETYTGIISAMENEISLLLKEADIRRVDKIGGVDYHVGTLRGENVVIVQAGIGKVLASSGVTAMLNNYDISRVFFTGIAGGVGDETEVLDVVIATTLVQHDFGTVTNEGFQWFEGYDNMIRYYDCDGELVDFAYDAAVEVVGADHVFKGTIATGDQFIASEEYVTRLQNDFNALACEMEGASVALVCMQYDVPCVVIRTLSDKADGNAHETYENMGDIAADHSGRILMQMLEDIRG